VADFDGMPEPSATVSFGHCASGDAPVVMSRQAGRCLGIVRQ
jgi:hypothetical protein